MYNGIGLQTARGSGTNGFVQRNLSFIPSTKHKPHYRTEEEIKKLDIDAQKEPNIEILEHTRKRALEVKCLEMSEVLKEEGYEESEIEDRVKYFRKMLMEREQRAKEKLLSSEEFIQSNSKETHAIAAAQQQKNARLKKAFGISEFFVEGSSLDPDRKAKEDAVRRLRQEEEDSKRGQIRTYEWISTPSPERESSSSKKEKKKKSKRHRDSSWGRESKKKRKSKKSKRSRSHSPKKRKHSRERKKKKKQRNSLKSRSRSLESENNRPASSKEKPENDENEKRKSIGKVGIHFRYFHLLGLP